MAIWYYTIGQERKGPASEEEIRGLIESGKIVPQAYVWRDGMTNWKVAGEHPDFADVFVTPPPLPTSAIPPNFPPPAFQPVATKPGVVLTSRPWPRFWARFFDNLLFVPLLGFGIGLWSAVYAPDIYIKLVAMNEVLFSLMIMPLVALLLAVSMTLLGSTPGKAIVGVQVPVPPGSSRFWFYLTREFKVWIAGLGMGIPFVALFTQVAQYRRLASGRPASYDEGNPSIVATPGRLRLGIAVALVAALLIGNTILRTEDKRAANNLTATQTWVSPVTSKSATIGKSWQPQPVDADSGSAFYFVASELLSEAIFGHETLPSDNVDTTTYANAIKDAIASEITINSEWRPVQVNGMPGVRATGISTRASDANVEVTIVVSGRNAWRTLMFTRGSSAEQLTEKDRFVNAMFGTAN
ncbi:RDD family protein [Pararhizobium sp. LjRoot255]|uniref:RDD family protein n=1 Tax=Pararhizobium sp. LjRoot255 TaxID=3342298 RepID=UPI003ECF1382